MTFIQHSSLKVRSSTLCSAESEPFVQFSFTAFNVNEFVVTAVLLQLCSNSAETTKLLICILYNNSTLLGNEHQCTVWSGNWVEAN